MRTIEQIVKYLLVFCVWIAGTYLLAITNEALFAIFLGSSMIVVGMRIPPRGRTAEQSF
jgi:hypothetical protein